MPIAYRCSRTGVLFPPDYVEEWGRKYGIGLGPVPVSEALVNLYADQVAESEDSQKTMHPVGTCHAQIDFIEVSEQEWQDNKAVLAIDDPKMNVRAQLMRDKQLQKSRKLQSLFPHEVELAAARIESRKSKIE